MNGTQEELLAMYKDIKECLDRNDIRYYGGFGTAIGALRHGGFIPWDDDIDLLVWAEDLPKIEKALKTELDQDKYYYHVPSADVHPHVIKRTDDFEKALKEEKAVFIDLFVIDRYPRGKARKVFAKAFLKLTSASIWFADRFHSTWSHKIFAWMPGLFRRTALAFAEKDTDNTAIIESISSINVVPAERYGEPRTVKFEDTEMPLPAGIHEILTEHFGDYMTPPPEDKRSGASGYPCGAYVDYLREKGKHRLRTAKRPFFYHNLIMGLEIKE